MTPTLQHRASNGGQRTGYNGEQTHIRQIKSGLDISDPQGLVKKAFGDEGKPSNAGKENTNAELDAYTDTTKGQKPANKERAQTANKTGKPPLASNALHNLGSAREKPMEDSLT